MEHKKNDNIDWLQNLIALISLVALVFAYLFIKREQLDKSITFELLTQIIPDLIAALIAVIVVYYFFIRRGISSQEVLAEKIISGIQNDKDTLKFQRQSVVGRTIDIKKEIENAKEVMVLGYSCRYFIAGLRPDLVSALINNLSIRVLVVKPNSEASKLLMLNQKFKEIDTDLEDVQMRIQEIVVDVEKHKNKRKGTLDLRFINWIPSCSMIFIIPKQKNKSNILKLKIYAPDNRTPLTKIQTHIIIKENSNPELYEYFRSQYENLWDRSEILKDN